MLKIAELCGKIRERGGRMDRVILHSDMNNCYASIELLHHPELRGRPLAVGGDPEARHGIVPVSYTHLKRESFINGFKG